jgi:hypothetical protein
MFNSRHVFTALLFAASAALATGAQAQACAGFTDVAAADPFCPNVEWLKNRSVTLGCTSQTLYCPTDPVSRLAMSAFMNRLGTALTPTRQFVDLQVGALDIQTSANNYVCQTAAYPVTGFPRRAVVHGAFWGNLDAAVTWSTDLWYSTDGGSTWNYMSNYIAASSVAGAGYDKMDSFAYADMNVGSTYIFAIRVREYPAALGGTGKFTASFCHLMLEVGNRNGTSTPYDGQFTNGQGTPFDGARNEP